MTAATKQDLINAYATWIEERRTDWTPFTINVVFKSQHHKTNETKWSDEYVHKVLWKINKRLSRRAKDLVFFHDYYYEFGIKGNYKSFADSRSPHHVHGFICIDNEQVDKVWDQENNKLNDSLEKSFASVPSVQSVLIEPIRLDSTSIWMSYIAKGKQF